MKWSGLSPTNEKEFVKDSSKYFPYQKLSPTYLLKFLIRLT